MHSKRDDSWLSRWASHRMRLATVSLPISKHSSFITKQLAKNSAQLQSKEPKTTEIIKIEVNQTEILSKSAKPIRVISEYYRWIHERRQRRYPSSELHRLAQFCNLLWKSYLLLREREIEHENSQKIWREERGDEWRRKVPNSNEREEWLGMKIESEEIFHGLVFASSVESGRDLTETCILSILRRRFSSPA